MSTVFLTHKPDFVAIAIPLPDDEGMTSRTRIILERDGVPTEEGRVLLDFIARHLP